MDLKSLDWVEWDKIHLIGNPRYLKMAVEAQGSSIEDAFKYTIRSIQGGFSISFNDLPKHITSKDSTIAAVVKYRLEVGR